MAAESATHFAILDPKNVLSYGQKQLEGQLNLFCGMSWGIVLPLHLSVRTCCHFSFTWSLLVLMLHGLCVVCLQVVPHPSSMEQLVQGHCMLITVTFYQVLPNFVSFSEHDQLIITGENSALQSGLHG